jgi:hypothetical protein
MLFGDNQEMNRRSRVNVFEGNHFVIFINFLGRDLSPCDFAKKAIFLLHTILQVTFIFLKNSAVGSIWITLP